MDTIFGVLIQWINKSTVNFSAVKDSDYILVRPNHQCPRADGEPIVIGEGYEWLANYDGNIVPDYDSRMFVLNQSTLPTNQPHPLYPNYNKYETTYSLVKRTKEDIIGSIREEESLANSSLVSEGEINKLGVLALNATIRKVAGMALTDIDANAIARHAEISEKMLRNASNAEMLINKVNANENIDPSSGWEYDNISIGGYPFAK